MSGEVFAALFLILPVYISACCRRDTAIAGLITDDADLLHTALLAAVALQGKTENEATGEEPGKVRTTCHALFVPHAFVCCKTLYPQPPSRHGESLSLPA